MEMSAYDKVENLAVKNAKNAIISEIRNEINIGVTLEVAEFLDGLIDRIRNLEV